MKLILSSCDFKNENSRETIIKNLGMPLSACRVLYIPDERADKKAILSDKFYLRLIDYGFSRSNITVLNYYDTQSFKNLDIDAIYLSGGNTFQIMHRLRKHGFDEAIINYVKNGVTYIGGSAGAHIASQNIEHVLKYDKNVNNITDFSGLKLFDGILICHFCEDRREHYECLKTKGEYNVYAITNDDSIVIEN